MHPHPPCWCPDVEKQSKQKVNHKGAVSVMQQRLSRYCGHRERTPEQHFCLGTQIAYSQHSWVHSQCFSAGKSNYDTGPKTPYFFIKELLVWSFLYSDAFGNQDQFNIIQHYFGPYFTVTPWKKRKKKCCPPDLEWPQNWSELTSCSVCKYTQTSLKQKDVTFSVQRKRYRHVVGQISKVGEIVFREFHAFLTHKIEFSSLDQLKQCFNSC